MAAQVGRNDPCPCGSGKKYKHCHLGKEQVLVASTNEEGETVLTDVAQHGGPTPTWKLFAVGLGLVVVIGIGLWLADLPRIAGAVSGVLALLLVIWAAFRSPPPRRDDAGRADAINYGMRNN